jgi:quercetin dioxygenase-like cupin family protein
VTPGFPRASWPALTATGQPQTGTMHVQRWDAARDGVLTASRLRQRLEEQGLWVSERRYAPGAPAEERPSDHDAVVVVLTGLLKLGFGSEAAVLAAGDAAFVPHGVGRQTEVIGSSPVVTYSGAFLPNGPALGRPSPPGSNWR